MLEKFKRFPVICQVAIGLQLLGAVWGIFTILRLISMSNQLYYLYALTGQDVPSKISLYLSIIVGLLLIGAMYPLVSNPNKQSVTIYFGAVIMNFILGIIVDGFSFVSILTFVLPGLMAYGIYTNREFFGI